MLFVWGENPWRPQVPDKWPGITVNRGIVCRGERRSCVGHRQMSEGARGHESGKFPPSRFIEISAGDTGALTPLPVQVSIFAKYET